MIIVMGISGIQEGYNLMKYCVTINNKRYEVEVEKGNAAIVSKVEILPAVKENKDLTLKQTAVTTAEPKATQLPEQTAQVGIEVVKAPMAGGIVDIKVSVGSAVKKGDTLLLLEAMKMENEITAHVDGIVADIKVSKGAGVSADDVLVVLK